MAPHAKNENKNELDRDELFFQKTIMGALFLVGVL